MFFCWCVNFVLVDEGSFDDSLKFILLLIFCFFLLLSVLVMMLLLIKVLWLFSCNKFVWWFFLWFNEDVILYFVYVLYGLF